MWNYKDIIGKVMLVPAVSRCSGSSAKGREAAVSRESNPREDRIRNELEAHVDP